jgi:hypothetical protein
MNRPERSPAGVFANAFSMGMSFAFAEPYISPEISYTFATGRPGSAHHSLQLPA